MSAAPARWRIKASSCSPPSSSATTWPRAALVEVLPAYRSVEMGVYAVYPHRKHLTVKVRVLIDFLVNWFRTERRARA